MKANKELKDNVRFASFDADLWMLLQNPAMRQRLRDYIIEHKLTNNDKGWGSMVAEGLGSLSAVLIAVA